MIKTNKISKMKGTIISMCLTFCLSVGYSQVQAQSEDVACLRRINRQISAILKKKLEQRYHSIKAEIKLIMNFHVRKNGLADSIIIVKSNLLNFGIVDKYIENYLNKKRYKCIWKVYYSKLLKPDYVVVIFNPSLT